MLVGAMNEELPTALQMESSSSSSFAEGQDQRKIKDGKTLETNKNDDPSLLRPKRPLSAYNLFFRDQRELLLRELPEVKHQGRGHGKIGFKDLGKVIGAKWRAISPEEKKVYEDIAAEGRQAYLTSVKLWKKQMEARGLSTKRPKKTSGTTSPVRTASTSGTDVGVIQPSLTSLMASAPSESFHHGLQGMHEHDLQTGNYHGGAFVQQQQGNGYFTYVQARRNYISRVANDVLAATAQFNGGFDEQEIQGQPLSGYPLEIPEMPRSYMASGVPLPTFEASGLARMGNTSTPMIPFPMVDGVAASFTGRRQGYVPQDATLQQDTVEPLPYNSNPTGNTALEDVDHLATEMGQDDVNLFVGIFNRPHN